MVYLRASIVLCFCRRIRKHQQLYSCTVVDLSLETYVSYMYYGVFCIFQPLTCPLQATAMVTFHLSPSNSCCGYFSHVSIMLLLWLLFTCLPQAFAVVTFSCPPQALAVVTFSCPFKLLLWLLFTCPPQALAVVTFHMSPSSSCCDYFSAVHLKFLLWLLFTCPFQAPVVITFHLSPSSSCCGYFSHAHLKLLL